MHIHFIQHMRFEYPASIADWAKEKKYTTTYSKIFEEAIFPSENTFDMLVILGGVMSVYDDYKYAWLPAEKIFIKNAIKEKKKVVGVCLGAQLVAEALGAKVFPHIIKEIGWFEVEKVSAHKITNHLPETFTTFHWHGDTFTLPGGAVQLFKTAACEQQGFVYNDHVAALQFHVEVNHDLLTGMTEHENAELIKNTYVQAEDEIKQLTPKYISRQKKYIYGFLDAFIQL